MTEIFRIIGKNDIHFDAGTTGNYLFTQGRPPRKMSTILTRREVLKILPRLPLGIRPMALKHGLSVITMEFNIHGSSGTDMEAKEHALIETLVETDLFFSNRGAIGTNAVLQVKSPEATEVSFKTIFYGMVDELDARDVLGAKIKADAMYGLRLVLYCEPNWRPSTFNHLFDGGFEFWDRVEYADPGADTEPDGWDDYEHGAITGTNNQEAVEVQVGSTYSLEIDVTASGGGGQHKGVTQDILARVIPGVTYTLIAWLRNDALTDCRIEIEVVGDVSGTASAYSGTAVHAAYTRYTTTFVPHAADTSLLIQAYLLSTAPGADGTIYIDGMMVVRGTLVLDDFIEWHPNPGIRIAPNILSNADFEEWLEDVTDNEPECWDDYEVTPGNLTGEENNRESTEVLQGCYALQIIVTDSADVGRKGVEQDIFNRLLTPGIEDYSYVLMGWIKNDAIVEGDVVLRVEGDGGGGWATHAFIDGIANDEFTRYAVVFTPHAADTELIIRAYLDITGANASGTVYFDKLMVIEASIYNGHSFTPEEWTGCGWIFNHYDEACGSSPPENECGHVNYLDMADLRGDVDARLGLILDAVEPDYFYCDIFEIARRSREKPCELVHWYEGESPQASEHWDALGGGNDDCSACGQAFNDDEADGYLRWDGNAPVESDRGRFKVVARVRTDDEVNTKLKVGVRFALTWDLFYYNSWRYISTANEWEALDLGTIYLDPALRSGLELAHFEIRVDYEKDAGDEVELDCIILLPEDEAITGLDNLSTLQAYHVIDATGDFFGAAIETYPSAFYGPMYAQGGLTLRPEQQQRLIFLLRWVKRWDIVHKTLTPNGEFVIKEMTYLPQFISPLE